MNRRCIPTAAYKAADHSSDDAANDDAARHRIAMVADRAIGNPGAQGNISPGHINLGHISLGHIDLGPITPGQDREDNQLRGSASVNRWSSEPPTRPIGQTRDSKSLPAAALRATLPLAVALGGILGGILGCSPRSLLESDDSVATVDADGSESPTDAPSDGRLPNDDERSRGSEAVGDDDMIFAATNQPIDPYANSDSAVFEVTSTDRPLGSPNDSGGLPDEPDDLPDDLGVPSDDRTDDAAGDVALRSPAVNSARRQIDQLFGGAEGGPDASSDASSGDPAESSLESSSSSEAEQLVQRIVQADRQTADIVNLSDDSAAADRTPQQNRQLLIETLIAKRDAASQLAQLDSAANWQRISARRARLQALSGLASLGDREASELLRYAAQQESDSDHTPLAIDARCVRIALAAGDLVAGQPEAVDQLADQVRMIDRLIERAGERGRQPASVSDALSTLASLGAARDVLEKYGEVETAALVRDVVLRHYAGSPDRDVARVAAAAAGEVRYQQIDQLLQRLIDGGLVAMDQWSESVETLIDLAPDIQTVNYLAPAALQLESHGRGDYADETYRILRRRFSEPDAATTRNVDIAISAAKRRRDQIGREFRPQPSSLIGPPINLLDYRGQIVLMPFWASNSPESTAIIPPLRRLAQSSDGRVAVIGMNLDLTQRAAQQIDSEAFASISSLAGAAPSQSSNPIAMQFGMVSLPFVAILDERGVVAGFGYDPQSITAQVDRLLAGDSPDGESLRMPERESLRIPEPESRRGGVSEDRR